MVWRKPRRPPSPGEILARQRLFDALYRAHRHRVLLYFRRRGHGFDDSEDMAHDVFIRLSTVSDELLRERPGAMVTRVARFVSTDVYRQQMARKRAGLQGAIDISQFDVADTSPTPEQVLIWREAVMSLYGIASELPKRCGETIVFNRLLGFSYTEIAVMRDVSVKTVEYHIAAGARFFDKRARGVAELALAE